MAFVAAMSQTQTKLGVNGETVYTEEGVDDYRVALFTMLVRGLDAKYIGDLVEKIIAKHGCEGVVDMFVMAFQLRDIRGGKGERLLFSHMMKSLHVRFPDIVEALIPQIVEYGCWRDLWDLYEEVPAMRSEILAHVKKIFDEDCVSTGSKSLLAKWLPREKSNTYRHLAYRIADALFSTVPKNRRMEAYRKQVSALNKQIDTAEIHMCEKSWASIVPEHVPGRCLKIHNAAFFNNALSVMTQHGSKARKATSTLRYPDDKDRMECRENFLEFIQKAAKGEVTAKGADVVFPHEIVTKIQRETNREVIDLLEAQWTSIRDATAALGGLRRVVPMCDFSGSMSGLPLQISLALGILVSEVNAPTFRDHILTFDSTPKWHSFKGMKSLKQKTNSIYNVGQGLSTDFYKACMRILDKMVEARVPVGEEPEDLLVLTDMGWDAAAKTSSWKSQIQEIQAKFIEASQRVWGQFTTGWTVPRIIVWNLRAEFKDFQAKATDKGVVMISGWSPNILKALQKGDVKSMTPYMGMRVVLDDERYDPVRKIVGDLIGAVRV